MNRKLCLILTGLCILGLVLVAGCTTEAPPEATPVPTEEVPEVPPAEETPAEEVTGEATPATGQTDIFRTLNEMPEYSVLRELLLLAGLDQTLATGGPYTLFAPNNEAFTSLDKGVENALRSDPENLLTPVLSYHVVEGTYMAEDLQNVTFLDTIQGTRLTVTVSGDQVTVDGAVVVEPDIIATNGVIHGIDAVLIPPGMTVPTEEATAEETANQTS